MSLTYVDKMQNIQLYWIDAIQTIFSIGMQHRKNKRQTRRQKKNDLKSLSDRQNGKMIADDEMHDILVETKWTTHTVDKKTFYL